MTIEFGLIAVAAAVILGRFLCRAWYAWQYHRFQQALLHEVLGK